MILVRGKSPISLAGIVGVRATTVPSRLRWPSVLAVQARSPLRSGLRGAGAKDWSKFHPSSQASGSSVACDDAICPA